MSAFRFDPAKTFGENLEAFLGHMESVNADFGAILRNHVSKLDEATDEGKRRTARSAFNAKIKSALGDGLRVKEGGAE